MKFHNANRAIEEAREINEEHRKLNGQLREEIDVLLMKSSVAFEMYDIFSQIDFSAYDGELKMCFGDRLKYDDVPWERWEEALEQTVSIDDIDEIEDKQLSLF